MKMAEKCRYKRGLPWKPQHISFGAKPLELDFELEEEMYHGHRGKI